VSTVIILLLVCIACALALNAVRWHELAHEEKRRADAEFEVSAWLRVFEKYPYPNDAPSISILVDRAYENARNKGFYDTPVDFGTRIALMHEELSEALAEYRNHQPYDLVYTDEKGKPEGIPIELADCVIRIFDAAGYYKIDLQAAILRKMAYNSTRPYRHGSKAA
jgi:NTP pyrophosphatase (non-canonical NTP hydrolase)